MSSGPAVDYPDGGGRVARHRLIVGGIVQGVGFRPYVHRLANHFGLRGWVLNSTEGVVIEVEGEASVLEAFVLAIPKQAPPRAVVERIDQAVLPPIGYSSFAIEPSQEIEGRFSLIPPDICICDDCLLEMRDPSNRRYRYPFTNCTNCGPRFTIVKGVPYDRPKTTMECFPMCPECEAEYRDPANRRFHAQPNACPACGPRLWLVGSGPGYQLSAISHQSSVISRHPDPLGPRRAGGLSPAAGAGEIGGYAPDVDGPHPDPLPGGEGE